MKISRKDFLEKAGIDTTGFDDSSLDYYSKAIKSYMGSFSIFLLKFAHIEKINIVRLAMNLSEISVKQTMLDKFKLYQEVRINGKTGGCHDKGYLNRTLYESMKSGKVIPINF